MKFNRSIKKCESWVACAYSADKGTIGFEHHSERKVLYQYVYYGSAKIGKPFKSGYRLIDQKGELVDVKEFYMRDIIYDFDILNEAKNCAEKILSEDPKLINKENLPIRYEISTSSNSKNLWRYIS